ncbi:MAG: hypothetical protein ACI4S4_00130, partial [Candidatus Ornithospirochaeta sp.]
MGPIVILLSLMMLSSCTPANVWQKAGITSPDKIELEVKMIDPSVEGETLDVVSTIRGERNSSVSFSINRPLGFEGKVIFRQTRREADAMAQALGARCYSKDEV